MRYNLGISDLIYFDTLNKTVATVTIKQMAYSEFAILFCEFTAQE